MRGKLTTSKISDDHLAPTFSTTQRFDKPSTISRVNSVYTQRFWSADTLEHIVMQRHERIKLEVEAVEHVLRVE
jgi:hypothetical protein